MNDRHPSEPQPAGRRVRPHGESGAPRRGRVEAEVSSTGARRAAGEQRDDSSSSAQPWWLHRGWWAVAITLVALLGLGLSLAMRPSLGTTTPPLTVPISTPEGTSPPPQSPTAPSHRVTNSTSSPPTPVDSGGPALTLPGTVPPTPADAEVEGPIPTATEAAGEIQLNDATFTAPDGWTLFGDEQIENSRRAVRLSQQATGARLQAVTLEPSGQGLGASCGSLVDLQQTQFTDVTPQLVVPIGVDVELGSAVRCGFTGVRSSDGTPNTVTFTLVSRAVDSHVLMMRATVPENPADETPAVAQLTVMTCEANSSFGVALPLC